MHSAFWIYDFLELQFCGYNILELQLVRSESQEEKTGRTHWETVMVMATATAMLIVIIAAEPSPIMGAAARKGRFQKRFSGFCPLRGYPPPYPLNGNFFCQKNLSGKFPKIFL